MYQRGNNGYNRKKRRQDRRNLVKRWRPLEDNKLLFILPLLTVTVTCIASLARLRHCVTSMRPRKVVMINDYLSISDDQQPKDIALGDNYELVSQVAWGQLENWLQKNRTQILFTFTSLNISRRRLSLMIPAHNMVGNLCSESNNH